MSGLLILINGIPGTGKTTLAHKLIPDLQIQGVLKDDLKEFYFEALQSADKDSSRLIGRIVFENLYAVIEQYLADGRQIIIECPLYAEFARPRIQNILAQHNSRIIEVYCELPEDIRKQRVQNRLASGARHAQHVVGDTTVEQSEFELRETYAPLALGSVFKIDTTLFGEDEYHELVANIKKEI